MSRGYRREPNRENNRIIAGLLAFIAGTFGVHRFYLNDIGGGIFYVFLFIITMKFFPVTMLLGIIEAIRLFNMSTDEFDQKYNRRIQGRSKRFQGKNRPRYERQRSPDSERVTRKRTNGSSAPADTRPRRSSIPRRNPFKSSAMEKYKEFELEEAIADFEKALKIGENDPEIHFYMAATYSLMEKKDKAFQHLETAVGLGLKDKERIDSFEDLAFVRIQDEFEAFRDNGYKRGTVKEAPAEEILDDDVLLSQLNKLDELRKRGLISQEEFLIEKEKLIDHKR